MKILVNIPTVRGEDIFPAWMFLFKDFQSFGIEVYINTGYFIKKLPRIDDIYSCKWLDEVERKKIANDAYITKGKFIFFSLKRNFCSLVKIAKEIESNNIDMIYSPSSVLDFVIFPFCKKISGKKIKWVATLDNIVPFTDPGNRFYRFLAWLFFKISLLMIKKADLVFASTEELETYLLGRKFDRKKVVRTNFAIENEAIIQAVRRPEYESDALFVGRINETKGIYDMLEVLNIVRQQYPHFRLSIMGEGDNNTKQKFRAKIYERKMDNNIFFWGYKNKQEKYDIIKSAKCFWFLSISKSESFGIALLEAVCSGIPAFCYNLPQFSRLYQNDEVNISPNGDFRQVAEKVIGLFRNGDFSNEKGKLLLGKYSWKKIAEIQYKNIKKLMDNCK